MWYICKPDNSCGGEGIEIVYGTQGVQQLLQEKQGEAAGDCPSFVAQQYVCSPMLWPTQDGRQHKFDIRIYVLVCAFPGANEHDHRCFVFDEGLIRICPQEYKPPKLRWQSSSNSSLRLSNDVGKSYIVRIKCNLSIIS